MVQIIKPCSFLAFMLLFVFSSRFISLSHAECNVPSEFWCDDFDIAKRCGVFNQCQQWLAPKEDGQAPLVQMTLLYESLCPDCKAFMVKQLNHTFYKLHSIMNLSLVPFGNAREEKVGDKWLFECQHGEEECQGNIIETCAINLVKDITVYFPFIMCMESSDQSPLNAAEQCGKMHPVPIDQIIACSKSAQGNQWEHEMAIRTPYHTYVPWVIINGVHTKEIENQAERDLVALICKTYTGSPLPPGCSNK